MGRYWGWGWSRKVGMIIGCNGVNNRPIKWGKICRIIGYGVL